MKFNWIKLIFGITIINLLGWLLLELWIYRYANTNGTYGAAWLTITQLIGYYLILIFSRIDNLIVLPIDCPKAEHQWELSHTDSSKEECLYCTAQRRTKYE